MYVHIYRYHLITLIIWTVIRVAAYPSKYTLSLSLYDHYIITCRLIKRKATCLILQAHSLSMYVSFIVTENKLYLSGTVLVYMHLLYENSILELFIKVMVWVLVSKFNFYLSDPFFQKYNWNDIYSLQNMWKAMTTERKQNCIYTTNNE